MTPAKFHRQLERIACAVSNPQPDLFTIGGALNRIESAYVVLYADRQAYRRRQSPRAVKDLWKRIRRVGEC